MERREAEQTGQEGLLDRLKTLVGCRYISDMKYEPSRTRAERAFDAIDTSRYTQSEVDEARKYIFGAEK